MPLYSLSQVYAHLGAIPLLPCLIEGIAARITLFDASGRNGPSCQRVLHHLGAITVLPGFNSHLAALLDIAFERILDDNLSESEISLHCIAAYGYGQGTFSVHFQLANWRVRSAGGPITAISSERRVDKSLPSRALSPPVRPISLFTQADVSLIRGETSRSTSILRLFRSPFLDETAYVCVWLI